MSRSLRILLTLLVFSLFCPAVMAFTLVEEGRPVAIIVTPDRAWSAEKFAAQELQYHLQLATGATLPILSESESGERSGPRISIGQTEAFRSLGITLPTPGRFEWGREKYPWGGKLVGETLYFYGVDGHAAVPGYGVKGGWHTVPTGTLFAVYDFLEAKLGVRWIWPGKTGEIIPAHPTVTVESYAQTGQPRYINALWRSEHIYTISPKGWSSKKVQTQYLNDERLWLLRQRFRTYSPIVSFEGLIGKGDYHRKHPDIVAMTPDGQRGLYYRDDRAYVQSHGWSRVATCVTAPELPELYMDYWKKTLKFRQERGNVSIVAFSENDIPAYCYCSRCRAADALDPGFNTSAYWRGEVIPTTTAEMWQALSTTREENPSLTDRYAKFWLAGLKAAQKWNPEARVYSIAYLNRQNPPKQTRFNDKVLVGLVDWPYLSWIKSDNASIKANWDGWKASGAGLLIRPNSTYSGHNLPVFYGRWFAEAFTYAARDGLLGSDLDTLTGQWSTQGPTLYVIARIHNDPEADPAALLEEFYQAFGPAHDAIKAYFSHWETLASGRTQAQLDAGRSRMRERWEKLGTPRVNRLMVAAPAFTPEAMAKGRRLVMAAVAAAANNPAAAARVHSVELGFIHSEKTLAALNAYLLFAQSRTPEARATLDDLLEDLATFRRQNEVALLQNLAWLDCEEGGLWSPRRLDQLAERTLPDEASEIGVDAE